MRLRLILCLATFLFSADSLILAAEHQEGIATRTAPPLQPVTNRQPSGDPTSLSTDDQTDGSANAFWDIGYNRDCQLRIYGNDLDDLLAHKVRSADLNGDGISDIVTSAYLADGQANARTGCGEVYIFYGGGGLMGLSLTAADADVTIYGAENEDRLGIEYNCGDINGDGEADLMIAADAADGRANATTGTGEVYVFFGGANLPAVIDLASTAPDVIIYGPTTSGGTYWTQMGVNIETGDVNGDGLQDMLVYAATEEDGCVGCGTDLPVVRVFYGRASWATDYDADTDYDVRIVGETTLDGIYTSAVGGGPFRSSEPLAAIDIDEDGYDDICLILAGGDGQSDLDPDAGELCIIAGSPVLASDLLFSQSEVILWGQTSQNLTLVDLATVDLGFPLPEQLWLAHIYGDYGTRIGCGVAGVLDPIVLVVGKLWGGYYDVFQFTTTHSFFGRDDTDRLSYPVSADMDGDGTKELVLGSYGGDGPNNTHVNGGFGCGDGVIIDRPDLLPPGVDLSTLVADTKLFSSRSDDIAVWRSQRPAAGDFNDDGVPDLIVPAYNSNNSLGVWTGGLVVVDGASLLNAGSDADSDAVPDDCDNCPNVFNPFQVDWDLDGVGDDCDDDYDNDGVADDSDADPVDPFVCQDIDGDGCDDCAVGVDGTGPLADYDPNNDGLDTDADGWCDAGDNCPDDYNPGQEDADTDGTGDICEGCCEGEQRGDANLSSVGLPDLPTIGDISAMVDAKFISSTCGPKPGETEDIIACLDEGDVNASATGETICDDITIGDISLLIDYLFITGPTNWDASKAPNFNGYYGTGEGKLRPCP